MTGSIFHGARIRSGRGELSAGGLVNRLSDPPGAAQALRALCVREQSERIHLGGMRGNKKKPRQIALVGAHPSWNGFRGAIGEDAVGWRTHTIAAELRV